MPRRLFLNRSCTFLQLSFLENNFELLVVKDLRKTDAVVLYRRWPISEGTHRTSHAPTHRKEPKTVVGRKAVLNKEEEQMKKDYRRVAALPSSHPPPPSGCLSKHKKGEVLHADSSGLPTDSICCFCSLSSFPLGGRRGKYKAKKFFIGFPPVVTRTAKISQIPYYFLAFFDFFKEGRGSLFLQLI